jgi:hypothetical protein
MSASEGKTRGAGMGLTYVFFVPARERRTGGDGFG